MNKKPSMPAIVLTMIAVVVCGAALSRPLMTQPVKAQQAAEGRASNAQRFEHCTITRLDASASGGKATGVVSICYARPSGYQCENVEATSDEGVNGISQALDTALAKAIAKLGDEGWEMVGEGFSFASRFNRKSTERALYFKRLRA